MYMDKMDQYSNQHFYTSDQIFLAKEIWTIALNDSMIHGFKEVDWMKESRDIDNFIGQGYN